MELFRLLGSSKSHGQIDYHSDFTCCPLSQPNIKVEPYLHSKNQIRKNNDILKTQDMN